MPSDLVPSAEAFLVPTQTAFVSTETFTHAQKDRAEKRAIYEENGVEGYWIVDTKRREVTGYTLAGKRFGRAKIYPARDTLSPRILEGFTLRVADVFA